jgi:solute carrier family 25 (mitochondrial carnitine/acylcarnitine transporter), member 20/29
LSTWFPLDTIKCRLQTRSAEYDGKGLVVLRRMIQNEGYLSLYRGLLSPSLGFGAVNSTVFSARNACTEFFQGNDKQKELKFSEKLYVGGFVGFVQSFVRTPIERVKTVMQIRNRATTKAPHANSLVCAYNLLKTDGLRVGLYAGLAATIAREVPQYLFYFIVYDKVRERLEPMVGTLASQAFAGGTAGVIGWLPPVFSIDVVKTRLQSAPKGTYSGMWDCAKKSYRAEGIAVFFRGLNIAVIRAFPLHGTIFVVYETVMKLLGDGARYD